MLNHPNIAAIYDLEESAGSRYLVLELVEGETLAERITRRPLTVRETLEIAKQIVEALDAAHDKGIIHRDLKPANIKITSEGKVKVLDFGLAKMFEADAPGGNYSNSPTLVSGSIAGVILGTASYMSPEQARGQKADQTTDIWALGCVLYEMLTGKQAFAGETLTDILGAVVKMEPDWSALPAGTPASVSALLKRCLQKSRRGRMHCAADLRNEIEMALQEPGAPTADLPRSTSSRLLAWLAIGAAALMFVSVSIAALWYWSRQTAGPSEVRFEINTPPFFSAEGAQNSAALSPDGRYLVFPGSIEGKSKLWIRPLDAVTARPLDGTDGARSPFWSPDGHLVGFFAENKLKRVDIDGGAVQAVAAVVSSYAASWSQKGVILFAPDTNSPLMRIPASGGQATPVTRLEGEEYSHRRPYFCLMAIISSTGAAAPEAAKESI